MNDYVWMVETLARDPGHCDGKWYPVEHWFTRAQARRNIRDLKKDGDPDQFRISKYQRVEVKG